MFGRLAPKAHYGEVRTGWRQQRARVPTQDTFSLRVAVVFALAGCTERLGLCRDGIWLTAGTWLTAGKPVTLLLLRPLLPKAP